MSTTQGTTAAPTCASPQQTSTDNQTEPYEEQEEHDLRAALGLRPIAFRHDSDHPDTRPCPSWCWIASPTAVEAGYSHEIDQRHPMAAMHTLSSVPSVALSLYEADRPKGGGSRWTVLSTLEPRLQQEGQGEPEVRIALREYEGRESSYQDDFLRMSLDDVQDLIAVLSHLVKTAEQ